MHQGLASLSFEKWGQKIRSTFDVIFWKFMLFETYWYHFLQQKVILTTRVTLWKKVIWWKMAILGCFLAITYSNDFDPYIYWNNSPPLGNPRGWPKPQVWGTIGSGLTPRAQKSPGRARFPALISVGGADRFLEDLSPDIPRKQFFEKVIETKIV